MKCKSLNLVRNKINKKVIKKKIDLENNNNNFVSNRIISKSE